MSHIWHPYTKFSALSAGLPPAIVRASGCYLHDADGNRYFDAVSSWWCAALGHSHPAIVNAISTQCETLQHSILGGMTHFPAQELARALVELMPDLARHVHFASDGACAIEVALKVALQYAYHRGEPARTKFLSLNHSYHGDTLATVSLGFLDDFHKPFASMRLPGAQIPVPPYDGTYEACLEDARRLFEEHRDVLAAVVVEPLCQCAAGMRIYDAEYLKQLYTMAHASGALFIVDEVATGFLRTGSMFAFMQADIDPDIVCVGKAVTGGSLPLSAAIVKDAIYATFSDEGDADNTFYHGHTYAGNPIACAAALAALAEYDKAPIRENVRRLSAQMAEGIEAMRAIEGVRNVRTLGVIGAVECATADMAKRAQEHMREGGYLLRPLGPVIYLMPPLITAKTELQAMLRDLKASLGVQKGPLNRE
ncbi:MAG: adenosylmethionine--8-amino-7-oxononanoate transaminase [Verrucomicrobia bacterium]|nr:adenosylmethionine--8-amino-7-oxononanoate transaminase [Verrucomicrobiota bacterium]